MICVLTNGIWATSLENLSFGFSARSDTNSAVQPQRMAIGVKFQIHEVEEFYYLCSKNNGADQLHYKHTADLHLCFCMCKKQVFSCRGSYYNEKDV